MNDPNALVRRDGRWHLFAQHSADPEELAIGWGEWSSTDLLAWRFEGVALPPGDTGFAYSGSIVSDGDGLLRAFHTRHDPASGLQRQAVSTSADTRTWSAPEPVLGICAPNWRDPFVWKRVDGWRMLLARPGDWNGAATERAHLEVWRSTDLLAWQQIGRIGPFSPPEVLWEVPSMIERGDGTAALVVSMVDRRAGRADSSVHYWPGRFDGMHFERACEGSMPLDLGPDFYAAIPVPGDPETGPLLIGWLSNWQTVRGFGWPGFSGGPIGLPRSLALEGEGGAARLLQQAPTSIVGAFRAAAAQTPVAGLGLARIAGDFALAVQSASAVLTVRRCAGRLLVRREGLHALDWAADHAIGDADRMMLFIDGPAVELFLGGRTLSAALPCDDEPFRVTLDGGAIDWRALLPHHDAR